MPLELGWANAMRWILTGEAWCAREALRLGLVQAVIPVGEQLTRAAQLAEIVAANPPLAPDQRITTGGRT